MKQIKKILFPIDFTSHFESLLPWVSTFARKFDATVYVLFVAQDLANFTTFYVPHGNIQAFQEEAVESAKKRMAGRGAGIFQRFSQAGNPGGFGLGCGKNPGVG